MGDLLEIAEGNRFEILAYRNAARALEEWDGDLRVATTEGSLCAIDRIGKGIAKVITELVQDGGAQEHGRLRGLFPLASRTCSPSPESARRGFGSSWRELGIDSLESLRAAAERNEVSALKGFGKKTEERIIASIERRRAPRKVAPSVRAPREEAVVDASAGSGTGRGRVLTGTSGYAYKEWRGSFYPEDLPEGEFLPFYSTRFPTVEINNSFYRFPSERAVRRVAGSVGERPARRSEDSA